MNTLTVARTSATPTRRRVTAPQRFGSDGKMHVTLRTRPVSRWCSSRRKVCFPRDPSSLGWLFICVLTLLVLTQSVLAQEPFRSVAQLEQWKQRIREQIQRIDINIERDKR